jgi:hypothetical protein
LQFKDESTHQEKLTAKYCRAIKAFASHISGLQAQRIIFIFVSLFEFKVTNATETIICNYKGQMDIVKLVNFNDCIFPFYLLHDKEKLYDGGQIRNLIKLYYQRITGSPPPSSIGVFRTEDMSKPSPELYARLFQLHTILTPGVYNQLYNILENGQHPKHALLCTLLKSTFTPEEIKVKVVELILT